MPPKLIWFLYVAYHHTRLVWWAPVMYLTAYVTPYWITYRHIMLNMSKLNPWFFPLTLFLTKLFPLSKWHHHPPSCTNQNLLKFLSFLYLQIQYLSLSPKYSSKPLIFSHVFCPRALANSGNTIITCSSCFLSFSLQSHSRYTVVFEIIF